METKQLVDKFISGEITEEQFEEEKTKLSPEDLVLLNKEAEERKPDAIKELINIRRGANKIAQKNDIDLTTKLREENFESAKNQFFTELGLDKDEDKQAFEEGFKEVDKGSITVENIIKDMKKHYASTKSDEYFELKRKQAEREQGAEDFNAQNGGSNGSGGSSSDGKKLPKDVLDFIQASAKQGKIITAEQAERALNVLKNKGHIR